MKHRILILMHYLELGGAEMALIGLLGALDPDKVDVDLFIYSHRGPLMRFIPKWVNLLPEEKSYSMIEQSLKVALTSGQIGIVFGRILAKLRHRLYRLRHPSNKDDGSIMQYVGNCVTPWLPKINPEIEYDLCISFLTPHNIGRDKVRAKRRLAWIHTDYSTVDINPVIETPVWNSYDKIASISQEVGQAFTRTFPSLKEKIVEIENILSSDFVRTRSEEFDVSSEMPKTNRITLLSIGRYSYQKNFDNIPEICGKIRQSGLDIRWYIIGFGSEEGLIRKKIKEANMEDHVILLGKKENPYPYIKACDIYVQPSRYEGKSVTVREAQILGKPVVITAYPTAKSQIVDGVDGIIVPMENSECADGIIDLINEPDKINLLSENCKNSDFTNRLEIDKIYKLLI